MSENRVHTVHTVQSIPYCTRKDIDPFTLWKENNSRGAVRKSVDSLDRLDITNLQPQPETPAPATVSTTLDVATLTLPTPEPATQRKHPPTVGTANGNNRLLGFPGGWTEADLVGTMPCRNCWAPIVFAKKTEYEIGVVDGKRAFVPVAGTKIVPCDPDGIPHRCNVELNKNDAPHPDVRPDLSALTDEEREQFNGRAAVFEVDGLPREDAERKAMASIGKATGMT